jgi:hypothetical protein
MRAIVRRVGRVLVLGSLGFAPIGCAFTHPAIERASREFSCPRARIAAVERNDVASNVYDLDVCGARVRYSCITGEGGFVQCTREPAPPSWDLDPALVVTLPRPPGMAPDVRTAAVCDRLALDAGRPCLERDGASWRWHRYVSGPGPMGGRS